MSSGLLGKGLSQANAPVKLYTVPSNVQYAAISIACVNKASVAAKVSVAISYGDTPGDADFIEFNAVLPPDGGVLERTCITCGPNEKVLITADNALVATRVFGIEQA